MKVDSSFLRLFRQSRYARGVETDGDQPKQNRRELFAVAAVAFTAKHDSKFAEQFLTRVAGVPLHDLRHTFEITPQAHACADLLITDTCNRQRYVIEFKVHARTEQKQSPGAEEFTSAQGYCSQMKTRFSDVSCKGLIYTVLSKHAEFEDKIRDGISCRARTWKDLIPRGKESGLVADLLDSLGDFGIPVLKLRNVHAMKNSQYAEGALQIHDLLQSILTDFRSSPIDIGSDEIYRWCGMRLLAGKDKYRPLRAWMGNHWKDIGWIGYLLPKSSNKPELSVWLYFHPQHLDNRAKTILNLKRKLRGKTIRPSDVDYDLIVSQPAQVIQDEKEWFSNTLQTVLEHAVPTRSRKR